jgi:integrating conjugative element protein (TIGR03746 family)
MSRYKNALSQAASISRSQRFTIGALAIITVIALAGWRYKETQLTAHIPPDLSNGMSLKIGGTPQVPPPNVYAFGYYIWQQINNWPNDGGADYAKQIFALQSYITPACRSQLDADLKIKEGNGELILRTRAIMEIPGYGFAANRVTDHGNGAWTVLLDAALLETSRGIAVKRTYIRYPLRVVRYEADREQNPFGLAIDCFGNRRPERLEERDIVVEQVMAPNASIPAVLPKAITNAIPLVVGDPVTPTTEALAPPAAPAAQEPLPAPAALPDAIQENR